MKSNSVINSQRGRAWLLRLVLAGLVFGWSFVAVSDEGKHVFNDPLGLVSFGIRSNAVTLERLRIVGDETVKQSPELPSIPERVNALLISGAGINDFVIVRVQDLESVSISVNRAANAEEQSSQGRLSVSPQSQIIGSKTKYEAEKRSEKSGDDFGEFHWFLVFFVLAFAIYRISWSPWFMNWTDRLFDKFFPENV